MQHKATNKEVQGMEIGSIKERETLHKAIYNCTLCRRAGYDVDRVQPEWDISKVHTPTRKWGMIIGQAPGKTERKRARENGPKPVAFKGPAGLRLRKWLEKAGFTGEQIDNEFAKTVVTKCYPGELRKGVDRKPTNEEIRLCTPYLFRQIDLYKPTVLIPVGRIAIDRFFPKSRLANVVGVERRWPDDNPQYTVVCLPHPSGLSRWLNVKTNDSKKDEAISLLSDLRAESCP
jgi:uracil-DNA glycosylase